MALDEALLLARDAPPTLRFYTWEPAALSLGYFQRHDEVVDATGGPGLPVVRRLTGGGAIHHADELTFSIACAADHPLYAGDVRASYERVHGILAAALRRHGVTPALRGAGPAASDDPRSGMCFHRSTAIDLVWGGRKGVGSAQRRTAGRVLHHGSIKLGASPLERGVATLRESSPTLAPAELAATVRAAFEAALGVAVEQGEPTAAELAHARARAGFFGSTEHLRRR